MKSVFPDRQVEERAAEKWEVKNVSFQFYKKEEAGRITIMIKNENAAGKRNGRRPETVDESKAVFGAYMQYFL